MKKTLLITILSAMMGIGGAAYGQTQSLSFLNDTDGGTGNIGSYSPGSTFSFDIFLTFAGYNSPGLSYWFQIAPGAASYFTITSSTYGSTFSDPTQNGYPQGFTDMTSTGNGQYANPFDLGGTIPADPGPPPNPQPSAGPGTYLVTHITLTISGAAVAGTYVISTTTSGTKISEVSDSGFNDHGLGSATYTVTIVPEPSTAALIALTLAGVGVIAHRRRALRG